MALPKRNFSFTIPSVHDDIELDCRLYYPRRSEQNFGLFGKAFAVFAHPYAPLGGSYDDPIVALAAGTLLRHGCILITFNFRGASGSAGKTSWSGKPELADYVSVYGFALCYIDAVFRPQESGTAITRPTTANLPLLILGGYSYGSMIASHLPNLELVMAMFKTPLADSAESEIKSRAEDLARDARAFLDMYGGGMKLSISRGRRRNIEESKKQLPQSQPVTIGGYESAAASRRVSRESSRRSIDGERVRQSIDRVRHKISVRHASSLPGSPKKTDESAAHPKDSAIVPIVPRVAYLLISPLLSPVAGFTTVFSKLKFIPKHLDMSDPAKKHHGGEFDELSRHSCLCIYGSKDVFTSDSRLQKWTEDLRVRSKSEFVSIRTNSGHFWNDAEGIICLQQGILDWLGKLMPPTDLRPSTDGGRTDVNEHNGIHQVDQLQNSASA